MLYNYTVPHSVLYHSFDNQLPNRFSLKGQDVPMTYFFFLDKCGLCVYMYKNMYTVPNNQEISVILFSNLLPQETVVL